MKLVSWFRSLKGWQRKLCYGLALVGSIGLFDTYLRLTFPDNPFQVIEDAAISVSKQFPAGPVTEEVARKMLSQAYRELSSHRNQYADRGLYLSPSWDDKKIRWCFLAGLKLKYSLQAEEFLCCLCDANSEDCKHAAFSCTLSGRAWVRGMTWGQYPKKTW